MDMKNSAEILKKAFSTISLGIFLIATLTACKKTSYLYVKSAGITGQDNNGNICSIAPGDHNVTTKSADMNGPNGLGIYSIHKEIVVEFENGCKVFIDDPNLNTLTSPDTPTATPINTSPWINVDGTQIAGPSYSTPSP